MELGRDTPRALRCPFPEAPWRGGDPRPAVLAVATARALPYPRWCNCLEPGPIPSAARDGVRRGTGQPPTSRLPPRPPPRHLVRWELDRISRARGPVLVPVGGSVEGGVGDPKFVGGPSQC